MGSSAKKKKEKKKDFQKVKLKVGKTRPKPENQTDTAFRSKAIVLNQQSLSVAAPTSSSQFLHQVSLLSSKSDTQRKESLAGLTTYVINHPVDQALPQPVGSLLNRVYPLILDGSGPVRSQTLKLLQALPSDEICDHAPGALPFIRAGMTHLAKDVRNSSLDTLSWMLNVAGQEIVSCPGGWQKTLEAFITLLGWRVAGDTGKWSSTKASFGNEAKSIARIMSVMDQFITSGIDFADDTQQSLQQPGVSQFPIWHSTSHRIPTKSNAFAHLNLFGAPKVDDTLMLEDRDDRLQIFKESYRASVLAGIESAKQEGGELGRAAGLLTKTLKQNDLLAIS